jgi:hypothetical protein
MTTQPNTPAASSADEIAAMRAEIDALRAQSAARPQVQQVQMTQRAVTQGRLGYGQAIFHWTMVVCTAGLWYPILASAKRMKRSVTTWK